MRMLATLVALATITACATSPNALQRVSVGMSKADVVQAIGKPDEVAAQRGVEYLKYKWHDVTRELTDPRYGGEFFFVRLVDGRVEAYGREGDFSSTQAPTVNVNKTIRYE